MDSDSERKIKQLEDVIKLQLVFNVVVTIAVICAMFL